MRKMLLGVLIGLLLGYALSGPAVSAQPPARLFGTTSTGTPVPIAADTSGNLAVTCQ